MRREVNLKFLFHTMDEFPKDGSGRFAKYLLIDKDGYWRIGHTSDDKTFYMTGGNDYPVNKPQAYAEITPAQAIIVMKMLDSPRKKPKEEQCEFPGEVTWEFILAWVINEISTLVGLPGGVTGDTTIVLRKGTIDVFIESVRKAFGVYIPPEQYNEISDNGSVSAIATYIYDARELF